MTTDDLMSYLGDFLVGYVQYGNTHGLCYDIVEPLRFMSDAEVFNALVSGQMQLGNDPIEYDTQPGSKITSTEIDVDYSGRAWTYQYCMEFGFFQTASKMHMMRSSFVDDEYWRGVCQRVFPDLDYSSALPNIQKTLDNLGDGNQIDATNIFFTNGSEDPW